MSDPFLNGPLKPLHEVLAAVNELDMQVSEIANGARKPGRLSMEKLAILFAYVRAQSEDSTTNPKD